MPRSSSTKKPHKGAPKRKVRNTLGETAESHATQSVHIEEPEIKISLYDLYAAAKKLARTEGGEFIRLKDSLVKAARQDRASILNVTENPEEDIQKLFFRTNMEKMAEEIYWDTPGEKVKFKDELDCNLHFLIAREQWPSIDDDQWDHIQPALRLVTMFLTTPTCWEFFEKVATGKLRTRMHAQLVEKDELKMQLSSEMILDPPRKSMSAAEKRAAVETLFREMAAKTRFYFGGTSESWEGSFGRFARKNPSIHLNPNYLESMRCHAENIQKSTGNDYISSLTQVLDLATTILHECAHCAMWIAHSQNREPRLTQSEPFSEAGLAYERMLFGFPLLIKYRYDDSGRWAPLPPTTLFERPQVDMIEYNGRPNVFDKPSHENDRHFLPASWTAKWFLKDTWSKIAQIGLGFMRDEAHLYCAGVKTHYPIKNWTTVYYMTPDHTKIPALCLPANWLSYESNCSVLFELTQVKVPDTPHRDDEKKSANQENSVNKPRTAVDEQPTPNEALSFGNDSLHLRSNKRKAEPSTSSRKRPRMTNRLSKRKQNWTILPRKPKYEGKYVVLHGENGKRNRDIAEDAGQATKKRKLDKCTTISLLEEFENLDVDGLLADIHDEEQTMALMKTFDHLDVDGILDDNMKEPKFIFPRMDLDELLRFEKLLDIKPLAPTDAAFDPYLILDIERFLPRNQRLVSFTEEHLANEAPPPSHSKRSFLWNVWDMLWGFLGLESFLK